MLLTSDSPSTFTCISRRTHQLRATNSQALAARSRAALAEQLQWMTRALTLNGAGHQLLSVTVSPGIMTVLSARTSCAGTRRGAIVGAAREALREVGGRLGARRLIWAAGLHRNHFRFSPPTVNTSACTETSRAYSPKGSSSSL